MYFDLLPTEVLIIVMKYLGPDSIIFDKLEGYKLLYNEFICNLQKGLYSELLHKNHILIKKEILQYCKSHHPHYILINGENNKDNTIDTIFNKISLIYDYFQEDYCISDRRCRSSLYDIDVTSYKLLCKNNTNKYIYLDIYTDYDLGKI